MEQFVKVEKKECAEKDQSEPQNIVTETLTVSLPTETPNKSCLEKPVTSGQHVMSAYVSNEDVMRAEILWAIKSVMAHFSFRTSIDIGNLFESMFPDSDIAKSLLVAKPR